MRGGCVIAVVLALSLGACASYSTGLAPPPAPAASETAEAAPPPATGAWRFERAVDRATGKSLGKAFVRADRVTPIPGQLYSKPAFVQLQCFKDKPVVVVSFLQKVGSNRSAELAYRFNDKPPRKAMVHFHRDHKTIEIEDQPSVKQFVADLRDAKTLFVSIESLVVGETRAVFPVQHAEPAIAHGFANCLPASAGSRTAQR
jgi:hypothetical protein